MTIVADQLGGAVSSAQNELFSLGCHCTAGLNYDTGALNGTKRAVTAAKVFVVTSVSFWVVSAGTRITIGYGDASKDNAATAPAGWTVVCKFITNDGAYKLQTFPCHFYIPAGKYPTMLADDGVSFAILHGYEYTGSVPT